MYSAILRKMHDIFQTFYASISSMSLPRELRVRHVFALSLTNNVAINNILFKSRTEPFKTNRLRFSLFRRYTYGFVYLVYGEYRKLVFILNTLFWGWFLFSRMIADENDYLLPNFVHETLTQYTTNNNTTERDIEREEPVIETRRSGNKRNFINYARFLAF